ncbi:hypothetical protein Nepgr_025815 [Nepenthes gracilis]|uniref:Transmembrane protein n=1 Tax=Nepenthes gracilis TaxID=150966 RepID=A0AAD3T8L5_NEPGR|nr:hypothetical protein Nepgr_025815 [Nepenthes gracilis]
MDKEQEELQFLGFNGICKESMKLIITFSKIFTSITFSLILPLSFIFLLHMFISNLLSSKIIHNEQTLDRTQEGTPAFDNISTIISSELTAYWLIKAAYFTFLLIISLLSTAAVVYTVASVYTAKDTTYKKVMAVVPKVWKRLMVTFLWSFAVVLFYHILLFPVVIIWALFYRGGEAGKTILALIIVFYFLGLVYISMIWQLAGVISVLEERKGFQAMKKSKDLIKGKMGVSFAIFLILNLCLGLIQFMFKHLFERDDWSVWIGVKVGLGVIILNLLSMIFLFQLVVQTVIYFVCKSYHHENIDKHSLADHLEVYLGDYVPLKAQDIQLEQVYV